MIHQSVANSFLIDLLKGGFSLGETRISDWSIPELSKAYGQDSVCEVVLSLAKNKSNQILQFDRAKGIVYG